MRHSLFGAYYRYCCFQKFDGNQESDTVVYNKLRRPVVTRYIRVIPTHWNNRISMRIELYGCPGTSIRADLDIVNYEFNPL